MKITLINENGMQFSDGTVLVAVHEQDCCERVYADWESIKDLVDYNQNYDMIEIKPVPKAGFTVNGIFVPCYDIQNGFYSGALSVLELNRHTTEVVYHHVSTKRIIRD